MKCLGFKTPAEVFEKHYGLMAKGFVALQAWMRAVSFLINDRVKKNNPARQKQPENQAIKYACLLEFFIYLFLA